MGELSGQPESVVPCFTGEEKEYRRESEGKKAKYQYMMISDCKLGFMVA